MFLYVCDEADTGIVSLSQEELDDLHEAREKMESALAQLQGDKYNRVLIYLSPSLEAGQTTYEFTDDDGVVDVRTHLDELTIR